MQVALIGAELEEKLALRYIHSAITKAVHQPTIFDFHEKGQLDDLVARIVEFNPPLVGLSMVFTARAREFTALVEQLRAAGFRGHITAGGHFASLNAEQLMQDYPGLSSIIHGEGEEVIVDLIENLDRPQSVQSLSFRNDGRLITNQPQPNADNLDARPFPSRPAEFHSYLGLPIANMLSSRGCFGNCSFCSINAWHRRNAGKRFRHPRHAG